MRRAELEGKILSPTRTISGGLPSPILGKDNLCKFITYYVEALCELSEYALASGGVKLEIDLFGLNLLGIEAYIEKAVDLYEASNYILGCRCAPCDVYILAHLSSIRGIRLSQLKLCLIPQINEHLQIIYKLRQ